MSALPSPSSAAERERGLAWCRAVANATLESVRGTMSFEGNPFAIAERLIPPVSPDAEEEVVGWRVVDRFGVSVSGYIPATEHEAKAQKREKDYHESDRGPHRVCKVVAVPETPDPAPSGREYKWEDGKLWLFGGGGVGWQHLDLPVSDIPHVAKLMTGGAP